MHDAITDYIKRYGSDENAVFVFPSDIAASLWLEEALELTGSGTLPQERFVAWDRFKEEAVQANVRGKSPVPGVLRKLYSLDLASRNARSDPPYFTSLIPFAHAAGGKVFADWIARILPQLEMWERKSSKASQAQDEDADLEFLKKDYTGFLDAHSLFEPAWQRPPLKDTGKRYIIFFPEAIEDFNEYAPLLVSSAFVETVHVPIPEQPPILSTYANAREEITSVALSIERSIRDGCSPENIALSVPDLETVAPYVMRELELRGIPAEYRSGFPLGKLPAGRLFSLLSQCTSTLFSFSSMKALLLDRLIPWKNRGLAESLVSFGIRNHCVTSWAENGTAIDVWEEAFRSPTRGETSDWRLAEFYRSLSRAMRDLASAESFSVIRKRYFLFREKFLDITLLAPEDDAVLARCVEELTSLAALEKEFAALLPESPFSFFVSTLDEKKYVAQRATTGVNVFPYRVAAGTPFLKHFVIDASQDQITVLYSQLPFLRRDRRDELNVDDIDASSAFLSIYAASGASFSFSARTFSGYRTPHGWFTLTEAGEKSDDNPYTTEREWFAGAPIDTCARADLCARDRVHAPQKSGVESYLAMRTGKRFSYLRDIYGESLPALAARISERQMRGDDGIGTNVPGASVLVTQTDLSVFSRCPSKWMLSRALALDEEASDAELFNDRNLGILYHDVLQKLYAAIRDEDHAFNAKKLDAYREHAFELARVAAADHAEFRGPIASPLIESLVKKIGDGIGLILARDAELLDGFVPALLEGELSHTADGIKYFGKIDRVSVRESDGVAVLIDYKSGKVNSPSVYSTTDGRAITDFQIPMYAYLVEESAESDFHGKKIEFAWFASIQEGDYRPIINDGEILSHGKKRGMVTREEFEGAMISFRAEAARFAEAVRARDFRRPDDLPASECFMCDYRKICRFTYAVGTI